MRDLKQHPLCLGIIGCGSFIQRRILPALSEVDTIKLVCLQKRDVEEAKKIAKKFNVPYAVSSREDLLNNTEVEAVFIGTPNHMHAEDAIACAKALKPTLCEKPLAPTVEEIKRMLEAFRQSSTPFFVGQSLRFKPSVQIAKQMLQKGTLGTLLHLRACFSIPLPDDNWRQKKEYGGGVLQDMGIHLIDLIRYISEQEVTSIYAATDPWWKPSSLQAEKTVNAICRLSCGGIATFDCSFEQPFHSGFEVIGSKSRLISSNSLRQTFDPIESLCHIQEDDSKLYYPLKASNVYIDELKHFAEAAVGNTNSIIPAEIGLQNQKIVEAAYQSLASQHSTQLY